MANAVPSAGTHPKKHTKREAKVIETAIAGSAASDAASLIKQTITEDVTTSAPSQGAVYDALLLKADAASYAKIWLTDVASNAEGVKAGDIKVFGGAVTMNDGTDWVPIITVE
jgi:hypothetical protein